ncbi:MAG: hypothetical protein R3E10_13835 [Gemmatimonadota bacterium]
MKLAFGMGTGVALALLVAAPAAAQGVSWGVRGGLTLDPDGFMFGAHAEVEVAEVPELLIVPSVDVSFGEEFSIGYSAIRLTGNGHWRFEVGENFVPFALGGLSIYFFDADTPGLRGGSSTDMGLNVGGGLDFGVLSTELWVGISDIPNLTLAAAYTFP